MKTILYIHGYNGQQYGGTFLNFEKYLDPTKWKIISLRYDDRSAEDAMQALSDALINNEVDVVMGTSLGAFLALAHKDDLPKVVINPCYKPSEVLQSVGADEYTARLWGRYEYDLINNTTPACLGFFADTDEFMGTRYKEEFEQDFKTCGIMIKSSHVINEEAIKNIASYLNFAASL